MDWYTSRKMRWLRALIWVFSILAGCIFVWLRIHGLVAFPLLWILLGGSVAVLLICQRSLRRIRFADIKCMHCGYCLRGLTDNHRCPECGTGYTLDTVRGYSADPTGFREKHEHNTWRQRKAVVDSFLAEERKKHSEGKE